MNKPFSQACENNKEPIRQVLEQYFTLPATVLEIGSGTGQHGAYISEKHPQLHWYTSDQVENLEGIRCWVSEANRDNFHAPIELNINTAQWNQAPLDIVYSANTVHIMRWEEVIKLFNFIPACLKAEGYFILYGPFNYNGKFTSQSNAQFNDWLKSQAAHRAIRDFEAVNELADQQGLILVADHEMPANNRTLVWRLAGS
ncbi:MAG: class I SAM-dependent methyltransferase [Pseudomonadales bacterium]|nr:class I SAM-dependent methyltransferase [Pseudomonadales bacterium]